MPTNTSRARRGAAPVVATTTLIRSRTRSIIGPASAAAVAALGLSLTAGQAAWGQTTQPVQINDVIYGMNRANAADTTKHIRGNPNVPNGGVEVGSTWAAGFVESVEFDNSDGFRHNYDGNMLAGNFGTLTGGGTIYNLETRRTPNSTTPGAFQTIFNFADYNTANPGNPLSISRLGGVSVSPLNNRIAFTGTDTGKVYVVDYNRGSTPGTGTGASVGAGHETGTILQIIGSSNTSGTTWLDNNNVLTVDSSGVVQKINIGGGGALTPSVAKDLSGAVPFPGIAAFTSLAYEPTLSPYVYVSMGQNSGVTENRLWVLDPNNNFNTVGSFTYSTSIQTIREIGFDSKGNLYVSQFGNTTSTPPGGSIDVLLGANQIANLANNTSSNFYQENAAKSAQFTGLDVAGSELDYKTTGLTVDVKNKAVTIPYWGASPIAAIRARLITGRNGGAWNGTGSAIASSTAATTPNTAIGYAEASELNRIGTTFGGVTVDGPSVLVKYTWNGDANLDGRVTFDDYVKIDTGFNTSLTGWVNGDFNYSGNVSFDDYVLIDIAFNQQNGTLGRAIDWISGDNRSTAGLDQDGLAEVLQHFEQFGSAYGAAFLASVPEPATLGLAGAASALALASRRRRQVR